MGTRIIDGADASLTLGDTWSIVVAVRDPISNGLSNDEPEITITRPNGATATPVVAATGTGLYVAHYVTADAGRHTVVASTLSHGAGSGVAYVGSVVTATGMPDLDALRTYLGPSSATDDEVINALDAEEAAQRSACRVPAAYPNDLRQGLLRRVARNLAMRGIPLAVLQGDAEGGDATILPGNDPEVRRFEKPWRRLRMG